MIKTLRNSIEAKKTFAKTNLYTLNKQKEQIQTKLNNLLKIRIDGSITKNEYDKTALQLRDEREQIINRINNLDLEDNKFAITLEYLINIASRSYKVFESSGIEEKRKLLNFVFSNLEIDRENIVISIREPFDKLLNLSKGLIWQRKLYDLRKKYSDELTELYPIVQSLEDDPQIQKVLKTD